MVAPSPRQLADVRRQALREAYPNGVDAITPTAFERKRLELDNLLRTSQGLQPRSSQVRGLAQKRSRLLRSIKRACVAVCVHHSFETNVSGRARGSIGAFRVSIYVYAGVGR